MIPGWWSRTLRRGDENRGVRVVQRKLRLEPTGAFDGVLEAYLAGWQKRVGLPPSGEVDSATAEALGESATAGLIPLWWDEDRQAALSRIFGVDQSGLEDAVRRYQSSMGLPPNGVVDEQLAVAIGDE